MDFFDIDAMYFNYLEKDCIDIHSEGFHWKSHGRTAIIYFVEDLGVVPIGVEMPGVDYLDALVYGESRDINKRYFLKNHSIEVVTLDDRLRIQELLVKWLLDNSIRHNICVGE